MRIGVVGINHKLADLKLREVLAKACQRRFALGQCHEDKHSFILLSTCNRTEVYFSSDDLADAHSWLLAVLRSEIDEDFDQKLYSYFGPDCFLHLCRVTAGLDSAIVAETEIQGQVKAAYEYAVEYSQLPRELHYLFQKSLKLGKMIRSELPLKPGLPDLEHSVVNAGMNFFDDPHQSKILCVGASDINKKLIQYLKVKQFNNITVCNRTAFHAHDIALSQNITMLDWQHIAKWHQYDWIIFGTKAPDFLITSKHVPSHIGQKLIIDLSVPRNVDPKVSKDPRITLFNIDQLNRTLKIRRQNLTESLIKAEQMAISATKHQIDLFHHKELQRSLLFA